MENLTLAFLLTLFAGLSTGFGSLFAFFTKKTNMQFLATALSFSAGVMIFISFVELFEEAKEELTAYFAGDMGFVVTLIAFFAGVILIMFIDRLVPEAENPHQPWDEENVMELQEDAAAVEREGGIPAKDIDESARDNGEEALDPGDEEELGRVGLMSALAIAIHNFPEGLVTFVATLADPALGISIAIAIALHNIPEGIAVAIPIFYATGSRVKSVAYSFLAGVAEPVGALAGYFVFREFFDELTFGLIFAFVAGVMVFISIDELLPTANKYGGDGHQEIYAFIAGMAIMAATLVVVG